MAENSGFFPDVAGDRGYDTAFLADLIHSFVGNGVYNGGLAVTANGSGMFITVPIGQGWINGYFYNNDSPKVIPIAVADGILNRKDTVVLRWDVSTRDIIAVVLTGTIASNPIAPGIVRSAEQYDLKMADIYIPAGATSIVQAFVTDTRPDQNVCGFVAALIQQLDTSSLYQQFTNSFNNWFDTIRDTLSGDIAGNLQNQITAISDNVTNKQDQIKTKTSDFTTDELLPGQIGFVYV